MTLVYFVVIFVAVVAAYNKIEVAMKKIDTGILKALGGNYKEIRCVRSAKCLLGRLIRGFIRKEINSEDAKTLTYLLSAYIKACEVERLCNGGK